jgi:hypothetical protein
MSPALKPDAPSASRNDPAKPPIRLLFIEDSENDVMLLLHHFRNAGYAPTFRQRRVIQAKCARRCSGSAGTCHPV